MGIIDLLLPEHDFMTAYYLPEMSCILQGNEEQIPGKLLRSRGPLVQFQIFSL